MFWNRQVKVLTLKWSKCCGRMRKRAVHVRKSANIQELKLFCKEEWAKIPPSKWAGLFNSFWSYCYAGVSHQILKAKVHRLLPLRYTVLHNFPQRKMTKDNIFVLFVELGFFDLLWVSCICEENSKVQKPQAPLYGIFPMAIKRP